MTYDGTRDEPPFDPDYDRPPTHDKAPLHDQAAERALLGALLLDPTHAPELAQEVTSDDFYRPEHAVVWDAAHKLLADGTPLDPITLAAHLISTGEAKTLPGGPLYIHTLVAECPLAANAPHYAKVIRDHARLRAANNAALKLRHIIDTGSAADIERVMDDALQTLDDVALRFGPAPITARATGLADLGWVLAGQPPTATPPAICHRTDGHALFYAGRVNGVFGDPESGKTWLAQCAGVETLNAGGTFAMVDVDHNGVDHTVARLMLLGAKPHHLADPERFRYYEPEDSDQLHAAIADITQRRPHVVLLDSLGEMLPMLGVKSVDNDEITIALRTIVMPPAKAGSCVITVDHLPKNSDARTTGYAIGGTAKKRAMDGAYLRAEARTQPAPGGIGRITLRIEKDRTGELRKTSGGGYAGTFTLDSTSAQVTTWSIGREDSPITPDGKFRPTHLMERISRFVEDNDQCTFTEIKAAVKGTDDNLRAAIHTLVEEGYLSRLDGPRRAKYHHSIAIYREDES